MERQLRLYRTAAGGTPFEEWLEGLKDAVARAKIKVRYKRRA